MSNSITKLSEYHPVSNVFQKEIHEGLTVLEKYNGKKITVFGSHRVAGKDFFYKDAVNLGKALAREKYITITGGGSGIMSAVALGVHAEKGVCIGMRAELLTQEHIHDEVYSSLISFNFLAARKYVMANESDFLIFYPGGLGTLDEFFEYLVQVQLTILKNKRIICIGGEYWNGLIAWMNKEVKTSNYLINKDNDLKNISIVKNFKEALSLINKG